MKEKNNLNDLELVGSEEGIKRKELEYKVNNIKTLEKVEFTPAEADYLSIVEDLELEDLLEQELILMGANNV